MKIVRVDACALSIKVEFTAAGQTVTADRPFNYVEIETDTGIVGHGATTHAEPPPVASLIRHVAGPMIMGADPMAHEHIWEMLNRAFTGRGQTGIAWHAISAIDVALWDIKGKALGQPLWRLLGGARQKLPVYATFGLPVFGPDTIGEVAKSFVDQGFTALKMVVGITARRKLAGTNNLNAALVEDVARVRAVREAVGDDVELYLSSQSALTLPQALSFARMVRPYDIALFQEPFAGNDAADLALFRRETGLPTTLGHSAAALERFRDYLSAHALDYAQPNVLTSGGYTGSLRVAALARAFGVPIFNGGAYFHHNMHLHAGLANATLAEWFYFWDILPARLLYRNLPDHENAWVTLPETPGLGFDPNPDAIREFTIPD